MSNRIYLKISQSVYQFLLFFFVTFLFFFPRVALSDLIDEKDADTAFPQKNTEPERPEEIKESTIPLKSGPAKQSSPLKNKNTKKEPVKPRSKEPIFMESLESQMNLETGLMTLIGDVEVRQGEMKLLSNKANVYYDDNSELVEKVVSTGNVKMFLIDKNGKKVKAQGRKAVFVDAKRTVTIEGKVKVWQEDRGLLRGTKFIYDLDKKVLKAEKLSGKTQNSIEKPKK